MAEKTGDALQYDLIAKMSVQELLDYVISNPQYLTDRYYKGYDTAIVARHKALEGGQVDFTPMMHVVMGNDFPSAVFSTAEKAEAYIAKRKEQKSSSLMRTIYWRSYEFPLDREGV